MNFAKMYANGASFQADATPSGVPMDAPVPESGMFNIPTASWMQKSPTISQKTFVLQGLPTSRRRPSCPLHFVVEALLILVDVVHGT